MSKKANPFVTNFRWDYRHRLVPVFFPLASSQTSGSRGSRLRTRLDIPSNKARGARASRNFPRGEGSRGRVNSNLSLATIQSMVLGRTRSCTSSTRRKLLSNWPLGPIFLTIKPRGGAPPSRDGKLNRTVHSCAFQVPHPLSLAFLQKI